MAIFTQSGNYIFVYNSQMLREMNSEIKEYEMKYLRQMKSMVISGQKRNRYMRGAQD